MNRSIGGWLLGCAILFSPLLQAKPCGGDGPIPFINMTGNITLPVKSIQSVGSIQQFAYWETQDALIYRNSSDQVRVSYFGSGVDAPLAAFRYPLSKLVDASERYLVTDGASYFFNASSGAPVIRYSSVSPAPEKLFWRGDELFFLRWVDPFFGYSHYEVRRYGAGETTSKLQCTYYPPSKSGLLRAKGDSFPGIFFYKTIPTGGKNIVALHRLNALTCEMTALGAPTEPMDGNITEVHRFEALDAFAVQTDHPTMNFRWERAGRCDYLSIGADRLMIPNHERPLAVSWTTGKGLSLFNLETMKKVAAFRGLGIKELTTDDLWIPSHQSDLLMSPEFERTHDRRMMIVDVEEILSVASH